MEPFLPWRNEVTPSPCVWRVGVAVGREALLLTELEAAGLPHCLMSPLNPPMEQKVA